MHHLCIIIPCFNEASSFRTDEYRSFLKENDDTFLFFVNDGSTDATSEKLQALQTEFAEQTAFMDLVNNIGKASAVREGMLTCVKERRSLYSAYVDADLAVSLKECRGMTTQFTDEIQLCFGSRILKMGSWIERRWMRFVIGRMIATVVSTILPLKIYDTQCGCKLMRSELVPYLFEKPFISKWLFDIELFFRMIHRFGREKTKVIMKEIPLNRWVDRGDSKVKMTYFFKLWIDLIKIRRKYRK